MGKKKNQAMTPCGEICIETKGKHHHTLKIRNYVHVHSLGISWFLSNNNMETLVFFEDELLLRFCNHSAGSL